VGSNKALRVLELISRKYANKKPKLSSVALLSLDAAAEELGITKDQLADRIIPNFDFDGTYREIEVEGETYRAYINNEFRMIYTNESNKSRKSLPRGASPELKKEFKEIEKEVKAIVKSQEDRLQRYMIAGRTWNGADWERFFFNNPIMFVYATQLIWAKVDDLGKILEVFYCDEDSEKFNYEDDEVEIENKDKICILHPCNLTDEHLQQWKNKAFEDQLKTIFPILDREILRKLPEELDLNTSTRFIKQEIPRGADYTVSYMNRKGYIKSTEDGGYLQYRKELTSPAITVFPNIEGPAAWYQNNEAKAFIHEISFRGEKYTDTVTIADVPDAFYSEIMVDMKNLIEDQG
ncbi:DUF4132 domain-containing protein, partial [Saprospiraceae bacterium]|nr:DUF4132 domain-containing protein [Saprospiraceae bacterium]